MLVVREVFTAKPGMASKLAALLKDVFGGEAAARVMTDVVGPYNTVVIEMLVEDLGEFERKLKEFGDGPDVKERMKGYTDLYLSGRREIFRIA